MLAVLCVWLGLQLCICGVTAGELRGTIIDADTGMAIPARIYLQNEEGEWLFVESAEQSGSAVPYQEQWVPMQDSVELHTTVSAHPFRIELPVGTYRLTIEHGKEYLPLSVDVVMTAEARDEVWKLQRWAHAATQGWYSGETHVHRRLHELANVMLAEDLNVAFPVTFWTTQSDRAPDLRPSSLRSQGPSPFGAREDRGFQPIEIDATHVILPRNTEYEIFSIGEQRHTLGAMFVLNHKRILTETAPPVSQIAAEAHRDGALIDLDKHSWPWAMMLVPVAKVDLFELANNSVWRTSFGFNQITNPLPPWASFEQESPTTLTEWGWIESGLETWYALLNCGFRLSPTAGTASGVHPVPLGFSRVYVHTGDTFDLERWLEGLRIGRSFVTNGPMLFAKINDKLSGKEFVMVHGGREPFTLEIAAQSEKPLARIEILINGEIVKSITPQMELSAVGTFHTHQTYSFTVDKSCWVAVRAIEPQADGRKHFAHTAPWYFTVEQNPLVPQRDQVAYFVDLMEAEIERNRGLLPPPALAEFEQARDVYRRLLLIAE